VQAPSDRWYVIRAEQFERALGGRDPRSCDAADVTGYLQEVGTRASLADWQFRQILDALQILLETVLDLPWASEFDWAFWRDSARRLETSHTTIARQSAPEREARSDSDPAHRALLDTVATEIRRRDYSVRTEQTYLQWIRRCPAQDQGHRFRLFR
jgi:hypothetical protein